MFYLYGGVPSRNLDEVFTYNHMVLMSLRSRSRVKASVVLTRTDHSLYTIIRSLLNIILRPIFWAGWGLNPHPIAFENNYNLKHNIHDNRLSILI